MGHRKVARWSDGSLLRFRRGLALTLVVVSAGLSGCEAHIRPVQRRFAREFRCPVRDTTSRSLGAGGYRVRGCGQAAQYVCVDTGWDQHCVREYGNLDLASAKTNAPATPPTPRVKRVQSPDGSATLKLTLHTVAGTIELRVDTRVGTELAVASIAPSRNTGECSLDLVVDGVRKELAAPVTRSSGRSPRFFQELPLGVLAEVSTSGRALGRICNSQFTLSDQDKGSLRELLMQLREEQAFSHDQVPADSEAQPPASTTEI